MNIKWKLFRIANYIQAILTMLMFGLGSYEFIDQGLRGYFSWASLLFLIILASIVVNNFYNLHLLNKYYPNKILTGAKSRFFTILLILYILIVVTILIATILMVVAISTSDRIIHTGEWLMNGILIIELGLGIFITIVQAGMPLHFEKNNRRLMQQALDHLGKENIE